MEYTQMGPIRRVSRLVLGGGGIGQIWGETGRDEASATIALALDRGINLIDTAPMYRNCEAIIGEHFGGKFPEGIMITSKCRLGTPPPDEVEARILASLENSLATMRVPRVDVFFLHTNICEPDYVYAVRPDRQYVFATNWPIYAERFIPLMEKLKADGRIGHWGITGTGVPATIIKALSHDPEPDVVQAVTNVLDSAGGMKNYAEDECPRDIVAAAVANGVGVMGIRAVQAGALTDAIDRELPFEHPEARDFRRAEPYRALCRSWAEDPAMIAHRYALAMPGVDTVILGVKNRVELAQCLEAEAQGPLEAERVADIDALGLSRRA